MHFLLISMQKIICNIYHFLKISMNSFSYRQIKYFFAIFFFSLFAVPVTAMINPTSKIQVPLPRAFGEPGNVSVSAATGAVSDSIQIEIPPGRRGIKPRLSFSYGSMAGAGVVGLGWNIGIGHVERSRVDGTPSVRAIIEQTPNDRYSFSIAGAAGELHDEDLDGVYRAKTESVYRPFRKIDDGWLMFDGQGVSYTFGRSANSRIDGELWLLDRVKDPSGNTITYFYKTECELLPAGQGCDNQNQAKYISTIHYTGHGNDLGANKIEFNYEIRPDKRISYLRGVREAKNIRLKQISVLAQDDLVRRYKLFYGQYKSGPSVLSRVILVGADDVSEVTLRTLGYSKRNLGWEAQDNASFPFDLVETDGKSTGAQFMDVNGDGFADMINNGTKVYLGTGGGSFHHNSSWSTSLSNANAAIVDSAGIDTGVRFLDVNGDARPDIFIATPTRTQILLNTGSGWVLNEAWTDNLNGLSALEIALTDANATTNCRAPACSSFTNPPAGCSSGYCTGAEDDSEDCITLEENEEPLLFCPPAILDTTAIEAFSLTGKDGESRGVEFADVNADGRIDIIWSLKFDQTVFILELPRIIRAVFLNGGSDNPGWHQSNSLSNELANVLTNIGNVPGAFVVENEYQGYSFMDVNSDGFADIVRSIEGKQAVYLGNGSGWTYDVGFSQSMITNGIYALDSDLKSQGLIPMDLNDDGLVDYLRAKGESHQAYLNNGNGWSSYSTSITSRLSANNLSFVSQEGKGTGITLTDIDGDGISDLISAKAGIENRIFYANTLRSGKLVISKNTLGGLSRVEWTVSTAFNNKTVSNIQGLPLSMPLVKKLTSHDGRGGKFVNDYVYAGGLYTDKGFKGFARVENTPSAGLRTVTNFYQTDDISMQPHEVLAFDTFGNLRAHSISESVVQNAGTNIKQILLKSTKTERFTADSVSTNISLVERKYNEYMQATLVTTDPDTTVDNDDSSLEYTYAEDINSGFWGLMSRVRTLDSDDVVLSETKTEYDDLPWGIIAYGLPTKTLEWVGASEYLAQTLKYDQYGNASKVSNRVGEETSFEYDSATFTFRIKATDPLQRVKRSIYDHRFGNLLSDTDASGNSTTTTYDAFGRTLRVVAPGDEDSPFGTVSYEYSSLGSPNRQQFYSLKRTENAGTTDVFETTTYFDAIGRVYETVEEGSDGLPILTQVDFGEDGQPSATSLPFFDGDIPSKITAERDDLGRIVGITDPLGQTVSMSYTGFKLDIVNGRGNATSAISSPTGDLLEFNIMVDGVLQTTRYEYDLLGKLTRLTDALNSQTHITYDALGRRTALDDPNVGKFQYKYDGEGRLIEQIGADGNSLFLTYSASGELLKKELADGSIHTFTYGTDKSLNNVGQLIKVEDGAGVLRIEYDARGRIIEKRRTVNDKTYVTGLVYDSMDRVQKVIYPDGFIANYLYDSGNNLASITDKEGRLLADGFQYNAAKRMTEFTFGNEVTSEFTYDDLDRMLTTRSTTNLGVDLQELEYQYDSANNVLALDDITSGSNQLFEYNEADQLVSAIGSYGEETYQYDAIGNLLKKGKLHFATDPMHPQRISCGVELSHKKINRKSQRSALDPCTASISGINQQRIARTFALTYDGRGNVITKGSKRYEYDSQNRLIRSFANNGKLIEINSYDSSGNLIVKQDRNEKTIYIDGLYEEGRTHVTRHIKAGSLLIASVVTPVAHVELITDAKTSTGDAIYMAGILGGAPMLLLFCMDGLLGWRLRDFISSILIAFREHPLTVSLMFVLIFTSWPQTVNAGSDKKGDSEKRYYYHANHLGSVNVVTDDDAKVTSRRDYRPYGDPYEWSGSNAGPRELLQTFQGQQYNDDTGLYNFKARYYDAELGRFLSADTIVADSSDPRTLNRYAFAGGNPVQFIDPSGHSFLSSVGGFFSGVGDGLSSAVNWIEDHAVEILTVVVIVVVVILVVAVVVLTGGTGLAAFAAIGGAIGFATFGGIALSQGNDVTTGAFWQAAGTGAVLGALVGAALPVAAGSISLGPIAAGALIGAASGGLEQAIACATGCGGVENLFLPVAQGIVVGGIVGAIGGKVASKFLPKGSGAFKRVARFFIEPGKIGFVAKSTYSSYSSAKGPGLSGRRTVYGDVFRLTKIGAGAGLGVFGVNTNPESLNDFTRADKSSFVFGALDNANTGLTTAPVN